MLLRAVDAAVPRQALKATQDYLRKLELGENLVGEQIKKTTLELSWAEDEVKSRREELVHRVRYAYMYDQTRSLEILFSAESLPTLLQRTAFLNRVLQQDRLLIEQVSVPAKIELNHVPFKGNAEAIRSARPGSARTPRSRRTACRSPASSCCGNQNWTTKRNSCCR
jgi:hypothetical protein